MVRGGRPLAGPTRFTIGPCVDENNYSNCDLFKIVTPLNIELFWFHLLCHPNNAFIKSVCKEFKQGFWLWRKVENKGYLLTNN
jgi:hypothetical protein